MIFNGLKHYDNAVYAEIFFQAGALGAPCPVHWDLENCKHNRNLRKAAGSDYSELDLAIKALEEYKEPIILQNRIHWWERLLRK